jgi:hypothetical protein
MGTRTPMRRAAGEIRRPQGAGSLLVRRDRAGKGTWYGKWWSAAGRRCARSGPAANPARPSG